MQCKQTRDNYRCTASQDYLKASFSYDKSGRTTVCVNQIIEKCPQDCAVLDAGCGTGEPVYCTAILR